MAAPQGSGRRVDPDQKEDRMKKQPAGGIHARIDALLPFSGTVTAWAQKLGLADEAVVRRALQHFSTSHTSEKGKRFLTHVKTEEHDVWTLRRHTLGYAEAYCTHK
jgi:hypothetical protein